MSKHKLLLAEDNELNYDMLSRRLEKHGYNVEIAKTGREAIELADKNSPSLILMDISLPEINGIDATKKLKNEPNTKNIPIIILTAYAMDADRKRSFEAGADEFETKPINFSILLEKIEKLIRNTQE